MIDADAAHALGKGCFTPPLCCGKMRVVGRDSIIAAACKRRVGDGMERSAPTTHTATVLCQPAGRHWVQPRAIVIGACLCLAVSAAVAEVSVQRTADNVIRASYWAGALTTTTRTVMCEGVSQSRLAVSLDGAAPDSALCGAPALPFISARILLPFGKTVTGIQVVNRSDNPQSVLSRPMAFNNQSENGYDLLDPAQALAWALNNREDAAIYTADAWYPQIPVVSTERDFRGYRVLELKFTPFLYHPLNMRLRFARAMEFEIKIGDAPGQPTRLACRGSAADQEIIRRLVVNPEAVSDYPVNLPPPKLQSLALPADAAPGSVTNNYYVIITPAAFAPALEPLRAFHSYDTNHQAVIVTTESIYARDPGTNSPNFVKILNYVCQVLYSNGCEYLLIGGDTDQVPTYYGGSDVYYSQAQFPVGRFSAQNTVDLSNCMAKAMHIVPNGADRVMLIPRADEYGPTICAYSNCFAPYLTVDTDGSLYQGGIMFDLYSAMDTHTILWARGHGYYLRPQWSSGWYPPNNTHIQPLGVNFGCQGCVVDWNTPYDHPAEVYHRATYGNAAYLGTVEDVTPTSFDAALFRSYFVEGTASPAIGDMMLMAWGYSSFYTLLGDPLYEIVSPQFKARPRITLPDGGSTSRSYNTDQGSGIIEDIVFRIMSFNHCGWLATNLTCDSCLSNHIAFSCTSGNQPADLHVSFLNVSNLLAGSYTIAFDIWDVTNHLFRETKYINLYVTDKNILTDDDFVINGNRRILPAGEYFLADDLVVTDGTILELQPGVTLRTESNKQIWIQASATIRAMGSVTNPIRCHVPVQIAGADLVPLAGDFRYCYFDMNSRISTTNHPILNFLNCTFIVGGSGPSSPPLFPADARGTLRNCLFTAGMMHARGPVGDLSGMNVSYCSVIPDYAESGSPALFQLHGREILWGNDSLQGEPSITLLTSSCINSGDPASPLDPDGTRADIGAGYHDLSTALHVPGNCGTIQAAIDIASTSACEVAIIVSNGVYQEALTLSNTYGNTLRIIGASETNRPILCLSNHPGTLVTCNGNALFENLVFRHVGLGGTGCTVRLGADMTGVGFKNCEFSGNRNNTSVLRLDAPGCYVGVCPYLWHTDFLNNSSNNVLVELGDSIARDSGGAPWTWIRDCRFTNNIACGTLLHFTSADRRLFARELTFIGNTAARLLHNTGAGVAATGTTLVVYNALFHDNTGEILTENNGYTLFENCTFQNNASNMTAAGTSQLALRNSIVWDNSLMLTSAPGATVSVDYTDINAPYPLSGTGNLCTNPLFVCVASGDFHLQRTSPCIDAGSTDSAYSNEPCPNGQRINMGRYGNTSEAADWANGTPVATCGLKSNCWDVTFTAASNGWYRLEYATDLSGTWTNLAGLQATDHAIRVSLPVHDRQGFLRIFNYHP